MPPATRRIMPARTINLWLTTSASAGASFRVPIKKWDAFIQVFQSGGPRWAAQRGERVESNCAGRALRKARPVLVHADAEDSLSVYNQSNFKGFEGGCMLDREGFRPNVGIILLNAHNEVFWGKRLREHSWQFPQGGIKYGETPLQAMYRELHEETGLLPEHVKVVGRTRDWLRYEVPDKFIKREVRGHYRGQKQIWLDRK